MIVATLPYEEMLRRHPKEVAEILAKLRKGKSKVRDADPETITWTYQGCVLVKGCRTLEDVLCGRQREERVMTLDEKVADQATRTSVNISARLGRWWGQSDVIPNPPEVETNIRRSLEDEAAEQARVDSMTPEERNREVARLLGQLSGPGFMAFRVGEK